MDFLRFLITIDVLMRTNCLKEILLNTQTTNWKDWSKSSSKYLGWRHQSKPITGHLVYSICSTIEQSRSDYWLFSSLIQNVDQAKSIHIRLKFTIRDCEEATILNKSQNCDNTFSLFANLLSRYEHESNYYNISRFRLISTVHAAYRWNQEDNRNTELRMNSWQIEWQFHQFMVEDQTNKNILVLGFRENSDCIVLHQLEVSYNACPKIQKGLVVLPKTSAGTTKFWSVGKPKCMTGASFSETHKTLMKLNNFFCQPNGEWSVEINDSWCQCNAGFFRLNSSICAACPLNSYKSVFGDGFCQKCPKNSMSVKYGQTFCKCNQGYFRNKKLDSISDKCTQPPSAPKDFYALYQTSFLVNLSWSYPVFTGDRDDITFHLTCINDPSAVITPNPLLSNRNALVIKLKPSRSYLFQLYTLNGVSEISGTNWEVMRSLIVNTDPLDPLANLTWVPLPDNYSGILQWEMERDIPKYNNYFIEVIVSFQIESERKIWNTYHTRNNSMIINNLLPGIIYDVKARVVSDGSTSPFGKELFVTVPGIIHNSFKSKVQTSKISSNISWVLIGNLLIISFLLLICLIFVIFYRRQKLTYSRLTKCRNNNTWNNQMYLQRRIQQNGKKPFKNMKMSNDSIYNILNSNSSNESPAILYRNPNISMRSWNLSYHQSEIMFVDDSFEHYSGHLLMNGEDIPVTISKSIETSDPTVLNAWVNRLQLMSNIKCHYISKLIGYNISNSGIAFIFEKVDKGNLEDYLAKVSEIISPEDVQKILKNILSAFICLFKMIIRLKTISLKCFWLSEDLTCKVQILLTNFTVEDPAHVNIIDFENNYLSIFKQVITLMSQKLAQNRDFSNFFTELYSCCSRTGCSLNDAMMALA